MGCKMWLVIKDNQVISRSHILDGLLGWDESYEIVEWTGELSSDPELGVIYDPRTEAQKLEDQDKVYIVERKREYPTVEEQLDMLYWDTVNGKHDWVDRITQIKTKYPKPEDDDPQ